MHMVYFKLFFLKLEGLHPLYFLKNLLRWKQLRAFVVSEDKMKDAFALLKQLVS